MPSCIGGWVLFLRRALILVLLFLYPKIAIRICRQSLYAKSRSGYALENLIKMRNET